MSFCLQPENSSDMQVDICEIFQTLALNVEPISRKQSCSAEMTSPSALITCEKDIPMDDPGHLYQISDHDTRHSSIHSRFYGCAYLQAICGQLHSCGSTSGEYLDIIHTHREIFFAFPRAHVLCARGFSDLARTIERREWQPDRDSDIEAAAAFRYEAWRIAAEM